MKSFILLTFAVASIAMGFACTPAPQATGNAPISKPVDSGGTEKEAGESTATLGTGSTTLTLYFSDETASKLIKETRDATRTEEPGRATVEALISGPQVEANQPTVPQSARLLNIRIVDRTAEVDFSKEFIDDHSGGSAGERLTVYSIVNSLTEFPTIDSVKFLVEGKGIETIAGHMDLTVPVERAEDLL